MNTVIQVINIGDSPVIPIEADPSLRLRVTLGRCSNLTPAVMLSAAKHLMAQRARPHAALRVTIQGPISSTVVFFATA